MSLDPRTTKLVAVMGGTFVTTDHVSKPMPLIVPIRDEEDTVTLGHFRVLHEVCIGTVDQLVKMQETHLRRACKVMLEDSPSIEPDLVALQQRPSVKSVPLTDEAARCLPFLRFRSDREGDIERIILSLPGAKTMQDRDTKKYPWSQIVPPPTSEVRELAAKLVAWANAKDHEQQMKEMIAEDDRRTIAAAG